MSVRLYRSSLCLFEGIAMEGVGCVLAGMFGTGAGLTSYSSNIGAIAVTKVRLYQTT